MPTRTLDVQQQLAIEDNGTILHLSDLSLVVRFEQLGQRQQAVDEVQPCMYRSSCTVHVVSFMCGALMPKTCTLASAVFGRLASLNAAEVLTGPALLKCALVHATVAETLRAHRQFEGCHSCWL